VCVCVCVCVRCPGVFADRVARLCVQIFMACELFLQALCLIALTMETLGEDLDGAEVIHLLSTASIAHSSLHIRYNVPCMQ